LSELSGAGISCRNYTQSDQEKESLVPVSVLITTSVAGFPPLKREALKELLSTHPEQFGHPHLVVDFDTPRQHGNLEDEFQDCLVEGEKVYFLETGTPEFRTLPWLLERFTAGELLALLALREGESPPALKVVEIPDDVKWHLYKDDDGSEMVRENARVWY
jgi:hypothetical protein